NAAGSCEASIALTPRPSMTSPTSAKVPEPFVMTAARPRSVAAGSAPAIGPCERVDVRGPSGRGRPGALNHVMPSALPVLPATMVAGSAARAEFSGVAPAGFDVLRRYRSGRGVSPLPAAIAFYRTIV